MLTKLQCLLRDPCYGFLFIVFLIRIVEFDVNDIYVYIFIYELVLQKYIDTIIIIIIIIIIIMFDGYVLRKVFEIF